MYEKVETYLGKLHKLIIGKGGLRFMGYKLLDAERVDNLLCCFLSGLPNEYKVKLDIDIAQEQKNLISLTLYKSFLNIITNKFFIDSYYLVNIEEADRLIQSLLPCLIKDFEYLNNNNKVEE